MAAYIQNKNVYMYGMWDAPDPAAVNGPFGPGVPGEGGVDLTSPQGTPVYALANGVVTGVGYWKDQLHGVVTTRVNIPGYGVNDLYYQHIIFNPGLKVGSIVTKGEQIGTVGSLNEVELGLNANWGQPWGTNHPQGWVTDPRPQILAMMNGSAPNVPGSSSIPTSTGGQGILSLLGQSFGPTSSQLQQFMLVVFAGLVILVGIAILFFNSNAGHETVKAGEMAAVA